MSWTREQMAARAAAISHGTCTTTGIAGAPPVGVRVRAGTIRCASNAPSASPTMALGTASRACSVRSILVS